MIDSLFVTLYKGDDLPAGHQFVEPHETSHLFIAHFEPTVNKVKVVAGDRYGNKYKSEVNAK
jgi:hypothetical protein